ncbi:hypothetical protein P152DRAFT_460267 [Eremomyces bilateralis CBS 781.70]|uniref:Flavin reductase like domain-containing protein n=1 Tax=Eremomyces bilateralis CBS 781.70 TaxID=1392243 RepID=A0A6G1FXQ9_9PEZI|nr:uncharacterized protein P152DRAFT_460267 [Eremomyces bilateralis CBS 781.70]KAF1810573.1 hypothetical protein P152DRAFT_460267 [Eremomyces bilateralis CBS 781.70]
MAKRMATPINPYSSLKLLQSLSKYSSICRSRSICTSKYSTSRSIAQTTPSRRLLFTSSTNLQNAPDGTQSNLTDDNHASDAAQRGLAPEDETDSPISKISIEKYPVRSPGTRSYYELSERHTKPDLVRTAMQSIPHPVVIVTAYRDNLLAVKDKKIPLESAQRRFAGMTVSSFSTVTLDPVPIVTFNIRKPSLTLESIVRGHLNRNSFFVHLLSHNHLAHDLATEFTKGNGEGKWMSVRGKYPVTVTPKFPLVLQNDQAIPAIFECQLLPAKCMEIHDHMIVVAQVSNVIVPPHRVTGNEINSFKGIMYARKAFREWADIDRGEIIRKYTVKSRRGSEDPTLAAEEQSSQTPVRILGT